MWKWQSTGYDEIYITVFKKQDVLISQLERFGFNLVGYNKNNECVYMKSRKNIDYSNPYKAFPFINPKFENGGYLLIKDLYHDTLFPYSELKNIEQKSVDLNVTNGMSKIYVGAPNTVPYRIGEPIFIYRIYQGEVGKKRYKSCLTSYCIVTNIIHVKKGEEKLMSFEKLIERIGNKSVFDKSELKNKYDNQKNMFVIEMLYYGYFGVGHNISKDWLDRNELWPQNGCYPAQFRLTPDQCKKILKQGNINVNNVIID